MWLGWSFSRNIQLWAAATATGLRSGCTFRTWATSSARYYKDGSEILVRQEGRNPRRLTPRECAQLMGFEKPGGSSFAIPVSDT